MVKAAVGGPPQSDALVLPGVTGDLAHKMIFPALISRSSASAIWSPSGGLES